MASGFIDYSKRRRASGPASEASRDAASQRGDDPFDERDAARQNTDLESNADVPARAARRPEADEASLEDAFDDFGGREVEPSRPARVEIMRDPGTREYPHRDERPFFDPTFPNYQDEAPLEMPFFDHVVADYGNYGTFQRIRLNIRQAISFAISTAALGTVLFAAYFSYFNPFKKSPPKAKADREYERRITGERSSGRPAYYAEFWGYQCDEHEIVTEGGWILKAHRISDPRRSGPVGHPVVLQHGILCNSSHFVVNEERSMAFWLVDQGFDVWITNIRSNFKAGHTEYTRSDPRFWAWGLKELAFDFRDVVDYITAATGRPQLAYVGHSQGSGSMYLALSPGICPKIGNKLSCFVALGPSVYAGSVLRKFPFSLLRQFRSRK
ncbi:hypothetical protein NDA16_003429 [Ustilago loliicola]|nr:hypothetical protein NDA16_003429 [Ustilago loliicola]